MKSRPHGVAAALALLVAGCGGASDTKGAASGAGGDTEETISLVAYSTPQVVYDEILPAFQRTEAGAGVEVKTSFGASGDQSRAVEAGQDADVVSFSIEPDVTRLVDAGLVDAAWNTGENNGLVTTSVVSFIVREGNPKNIEGWDDLLEPGVEVLTPNPFTSGAAKWNLLGAYAHGGLDYVRELLHEHVEVQDKSGREALQSFLSGNGDVLISYEYEALTAQKKGEEIELVIPDDTVKIDINLATTNDAPAAAQALHDYILSAPAQELFASWGYRPVNESVLARHDFPAPPELRTIQDLGGWDEVNAELFDPETGPIAEIVER